MAANERQITNVRDVVTAGSILMLAIIVLDVYAPVLFSMVDPSVELFEFRLLLFVGASLLTVSVFLFRSRQIRRWLMQTI